MSFPDSTTVTPVFLQEECDWGKAVSVSQTWRTDISTSRKQTEQRATRTYQPKYGINYSLSALTPAEFTLRRAKAIVEMGSPVVVPIWTARYAVTAIAANSVQPTISLSPFAKKFKVDSFVYLVETGKVSTFRRITSIAGATINLHATDGYPPPAFPTFTTAAFVYPCIFGMRTGHAVTWRLAKIDNTGEQIAIEEL